MNNINEYINSGILELFVLGKTSAEETLEVSKLAELHPEIKHEIDEISNALQIHSSSKSKNLSENVKAFVLATIDYSERLTNGEQVSFPPILNTSSKIDDYNEWILRPDMVLPEDADDTFGKVIGANAEATTIITWLKKGSPVETHETEFERFLILEGTCDITIGTTVHNLKAGDYKEIPLYEPHSLVVTSNTPCKVILQRVAA
jgi:mannose-6-phosphate isomerase-like protein (cupin superfamily)